MSANKLYEHKDSDISILEYPTYIEWVEPVTTDGSVTDYETFFVDSGAIKTVRGNKSVFKVDKTYTDLIKATGELVGTDLPPLYKHKAPTKILPVPTTVIRPTTAGRGRGITSAPVMAGRGGLPTKAAAYAQPAGRGYGRGRGRGGYGGYGAQTYEPAQVWESWRILYDGMTEAGTDLYIVDYSEKSFAMFADEKWSRENTSDFKAVGGTFNKSLFDDPSGTSKRPGWIFGKNKQEARDYFVQLTGVDMFADVPLVAKATRTPTRTVLPPKSGASSTGISTLPPRGGKVVKPPVQEIKMPELTLADHLSAIHDAFSLPMDAAETHDLAPLSTFVRVAIVGPTAKVDEAVTAYEQQFPLDQFGTVKDMEMIKGATKMVVMLRSDGSDG